MNIDSIIKTIDIFKPNDCLIEIRTVTGKSGYFKNKETLLRQLKQYQNETWYFVMNDIQETCYNREQREKIMFKKGLNTTSDKEIEQRNWFLIDADPIRMAGVSSTDEEKKKSKDTITKIYKYLNGLGYSHPIIADSGNGYHLLYNIILENSDENKTLLQETLQVLDMFFSDEHSKVDTSVYNAARITKLYGTMARKGANTEERPHRESKIIHVPDKIQPTSFNLLKLVASEMPKKEVKPSYHNYGNKNNFDIDDFVNKHGIRINSDTHSNGQRKMILENCVFNPEHKAKDSAIFVLSDGTIGYKCFHDSCSRYTWKDVRLKFEPDAYDYENKYNQTRVTNSIEVPKFTESNLIDEKTVAFVQMHEIDNHKKEKTVVIESGFTELDKKILGFNKGEISVWSGSNGSGKSSIISQLAIEAVDKGYKVGLFSGELKSERVKDWISLQSAGRRHTLLSNNGVTYWIKTHISKKIDEWYKGKFWIYKNEVGLDAYKIMSYFKKHIKENPVDVMIVDNLMSIDSRSINKDKYESQKLIVMLLKEFASAHNIHIHFVCHPKKSQGFLRKEDVSGTADITNLADNVFMVHRVNKDFEKRASEYLDPIEVKRLLRFSNIIETMKNRDQGVADEMTGLFYEVESKRFLNYENESKVYGWEKNEYGWIPVDDSDFPFNEV